MDIRRREPSGIDERAAHNEGLVAQRADACGGYHDPALNAFVYRPKLLSEGLLTPLVVVDGTGEHSRGNEWEPSSNVTIEKVDPATPTPVVEVEDMTPNSILLDDGDVEPNPGPINLNQFPGQPTEETA
jgi:hypothetical protein